MFGESFVTMTMLAGTLVTGDGGAAASGQDNTSPREIDVAYDAYIEAFNSGDRAVYRDFVAEWFDNEGQVAEADIEAFSGGMLDVYRRLGPVEVRSVELDLETTQEAWVTGEFTGGQSLLLVQIGSDGSLSALADTSGLRAGRSANRLEEVTPESLSQTLDPYFERLVEEDLFSGGAWIAMGGEIVYSFSGGPRDRRTDETINADTLFNPASIGKMMTATVVLSLIEEGVLDLQDPIGKWIPKYPEPWASKITIEHLLTHTSGIELDDDDTCMAALAEARSIGEMIALQVAHVERVLALATFDPGGRFNYTNEGYVLLGGIAEVASGSDFEDLLRERVFEPAGMVRTIPRRELGGLENVAVPHSIVRNRRNGTYFETVSPLVDTDFGHSWLASPVTVPASPVYATGADLIRFLSALAHGKLVSAELVEAMFTPHVLRSDEEAYGLREDQGLGVKVVQEHGVHSIGHDGGVPGFRAKLYYYPDNDMTILTWSNSEGANATAHQHMEDLTAVRTN